MNERVGNDAGFGGANNTPELLNSQKRASSTSATEGMPSFGLVSAGFADVTRPSAERGRSSVNRGSLFDHSTFTATLPLSAKFMPQVARALATGKSSSNERP